MGEVAFINDSGAEGWMVIGANSKETLEVVGRDVQVSNTFGDGVRAGSGRHKPDWTGKAWSKFAVAVEKVKTTSAGGPGTGVKLGMVIARDSVKVHRSRGSADRKDRSIGVDVRTGCQRDVWNINSVEVRKDIIGGPPLI